MAVIPFHLWPAQLALVWHLMTSPRTIILKARQLGISWLCCAYALWLCLFFDGKVVLLFSKGQLEADELLRRVKVMYQRLPDWMRSEAPSLTKENTGELAWSNGSRVMSLPATQSAGRSFTASLVIADEFAFMQWASELYTAMKPVIDGGGQLIILSTANGVNNLFHDLWERAEKGLNAFKAVFLSWRARPERTDAWRAAVEAESEISALVDQEYPSLPSDAFISTDRTRFLEDMALWDACQEQLPPLDRHTPCVLALDAGESSDTFATVLVSLHPRQPALLAARYARAYVPTGGAALNFDDIENDVRGLIAGHAIRELTYDPFLLGQTMRRFTTGPKRIAVPMFPFPQQAPRLEADKGLYDVIVQQRFAHDGNPQLRAHIDNADRKLDTESRKLRIVKRKHALKIDLAVALSMGCARASAVLRTIAQPAQAGPPRQQLQQVRIRR